VTDSDENREVAAEPDGRLLRAARAERLLSIRELATLAEVAPSTIRLIETGRSTPRLAVVRRLAEALYVDPHTIVEFRRAIRSHGGRG
jgi:transcriptional regulator with XRE-family HTH domain